MRRYYSLQILRAFAAWMVLGHHFMQLFYFYKWDSFMGQFFVLHGAFGIDIFFVLSGFVMYLNAKRPHAAAPSFFVKRFLRIMPAWWFWTTVFIFWVWIFPKPFVYTDYNFLSLVKSYLLIPGENPSGIGLLPFLTPGWTLIYEFAFYSILSLCLLISRKYAVEICFVVIAALPFIMPEGLTYSPVLGSTTILQFLFGILLGYYCGSMLENRINSIFPWQLQVIGLLIIAAISLTGILVAGIISRTAAATCIVMAGILLDDKFSYESALERFLVRSGDYSYSIYLCHGPAIGMWVTFRGEWAPLWVDLLCLIAIMVTSQIFAAFSFRFVEHGSLVTKTKKVLLTAAGKIENRLYGS